MLVARASLGFRGRYTAPRRRRWRLAAIAVAAAAVGMLTAPSLALADTSCAGGNGTYTSNEWRYLPFTNTYKSWWGSDWTYNAYRLRSDGTVAYHVYIETQDNIRTHTFTNSVDVFRRTAIQRGGYGNALWAMEQWAMGSC